MDTRHLIAYGLLVAILIVPILVLRRLKSSARRERRQAERPIRITRERSKRD